MLNILISTNRSYLDKAQTMLHSLRRNNNEDVTVYFINHSLSDNEIKKFGKYLRKHLKMNFNVLDVTNTFFDKIYIHNNRFSIEMYYRILAQFLLPETVDRVLWLDADIVICGNLSEFYHQSFEGKLLASCPDALCNSKEIAEIKDKIGLPKEHIYFNSGVLLLNIEALRKETTLDEIVKTAKSISKYFMYPDQDLLNYLYSGKVKYCSQNKFNCQTVSFKSLSGSQTDDIVILHYAGNQKPWLFYYLHDLSKFCVPYIKEISLQGKLFALIKLSVLYLCWLVYYKTGICNIVRKELNKNR